MNETRFENMNHIIFIFIIIIYSIYVIIKVFRKILYNKDIYQIYNISININQLSSYIYISFGIHKEII